MHGSTVDTERTSGRQVEGGGGGRGGGGGGQVGRWGDRLSGQVSLTTP